MVDLKPSNISDEIIKTLGLRLSDKRLSDQLAGNARVFEYPHLDNVYIMESDLYGNVMPDASCFLAFYGKNGLMGKHLTIEKLLRASIEDVKHMVHMHEEG